MDCSGELGTVGHPTPALHLSRRARPSALSLPPTGNFVLPCLKTACSQCPLHWTRLGEGGQGRTQPPPPLANSCAGALLPGSRSLPGEQNGRAQERPPRPEDSQPVRGAARSERAGPAQPCDDGSWSCRQRANGIGRAGMAAALLLGVAILAGLSVWLYYFLRGPKCCNETSLRGKTVLVTGGNTGIGKATALDLARRGARVILACRNKERGESAVCDIRRESGNNEVLFMSLDLASRSSVQAFADAFLKSEPRLDLLINNAGVLYGATTADGFNSAFHVNHLGHFQLTHLLLERLKCCAPSRVVVVASDSHRWGKIDFQEIHKPVRGIIKSFLAYANSKLANILYTRELANRLEGTGVTCYAAHPGAVYTDVFRNFPIWVKIIYTPFTWLFFRSPMEGAQTSIYCATQEDIEKCSGHYFENCKLTDPSSQACDDAVAKKLWEFSESLLGFAD